MSTAEIASPMASPSLLVGLRREFARPGLGRLTVIMLVLVVWEIAGRWLVNPIFLSPPLAVAMAFPGMISARGVAEALGITLYELIVGFALSALIGVALGLVLGLSSVSRRALLPIVLFLYALPQITILPLLIMSLGIGPEMKIAFGVTHGVFPIILVVAAGAQNLDRTLVLSARVMGAGRLDIFRYLVLPHMMQTLFSGLRLGMVGTMLGVLIAELYVSVRGIGYFTHHFTETYQTDKLYALILLLAAMAVVLNETLRRLELHFSRWKG